MRRLRLSVLFGLLLAFSACALPPVAEADSIWHTQVITTSTTASACLALDSNGQPHIAYTLFTPGNPHNISTWSPHNGLNSVVYAGWDGSKWVNQTVATDAGVYDLALDSHGMPHILYKSLWGASDQHLMYTYWSGFSWNRLDLGVSVYACSLALDSTATPHVAYVMSRQSETGFVLCYATLSGSQWATQNVTSKDVSMRCNLKFDAENTPQILYLTETEDYAKAETHFATQKADSTWTTQNTIQSADRNIEFKNLAHNAAGNPLFGFGSSLAVYNGSGWAENSFSDALNISMGFDGGYVAMDNLGNPCLDGVLSSLSNSLVFVRWVGDEWKTSVVDDGTIGSGPLAVNREGVAHVLYYKPVPGGAYPPLVCLAYAYGSAGAVSMSDYTDQSGNPELGFFVQSPVWFAASAAVVAVGLLALAVWRKRNLKTAA